MDNRMFTPIQSGGPPAAGLQGPRPGMPPSQGQFAGPRPLQPMTNPLMPVQNQWQPNAMPAQTQWQQQSQQGQQYQPGAQVFRPPFVPPADGMPGQQPMNIGPRPLLPSVVQPQPPPAQPFAAPPSRPGPRAGPGFQTGPGPQPGFQPQLGPGFQPGPLGPQPGVPVSQPVPTFQPQPGPGSQPGFQSVPSPLRPLGPGPGPQIVPPGSGGARPPSGGTFPPPLVGTGPIPRPPMCIPPPRPTATAPLPDPLRAPHPVVGPSPQTVDGRGPSGPSQFAPQQPSVVPQPNGPQNALLSGSHLSPANGPSGSFAAADLLPPSVTGMPSGPPPRTNTPVLQPSVNSGGVTPNSSTSSLRPGDNEVGRPTNLPIPFQGQAQYSHQIRGRSDGLTPNTSEPPSHRSTPIDGGPLMSSQQMDSLEGGHFTSVAPGPGVVAQPPAPGQWTLTQGQETHKSVVTGRRHYPQMVGNYVQTTRPVMPPPLQPMPGVGQPAMPGVPGVGGIPAPRQPLGAPGARMAYPQQQSQQPSYPPVQMSDAFSASLQHQPFATNFANMSLQGSGAINLLTEKNLVSGDGVELPTPQLPPEWKKSHTNPDLFRCTLNAVPNTQSLLNKSRLPFGILVHPFKDLTQLPVIQSSVIVRCRSCRTYINPFVQFLDSRRWKCNLCFRANDLPEEFSYDPASKTYGDPQRRPEIKSATIEFIAPSEYMLRPPQPAVYLFVLDVSFGAIETGYLEMACHTLIDCIDRLPGDTRTQIGFVTFDRSLHFYSLSEGLAQHEMFVVSDVDDVFLPCPDGLLVNLLERKDQIVDLLNRLPGLFAKNYESASAAGAALQAAFKLASPTGGRVSLFVAGLPTVGPGALKSREDPNERSGKAVSNLGPATDFYKKLSLECNAQQIAVDLFFLSGQYCDIASIGGVAKFSGGNVYYFPSYHSIKNPVEVKRFEAQLTRYLTRKIGFEAVMRIRCTRGVVINTFHGNFFVRSTDLLALPNINPDAGFAMQMAIDDNLECSHVCFQVALLYTSSKGERRIRVHTLCLPVTSQLSEVHAGADQLAIISLLAKMATDRSVQQSLGDAREALITAAIDMLTSYGSTLVTSQRVGQLPTPHCLRLIPLYVLALIKFTAFRVGVSTKLDDRTFALESCKTLPLPQLMQVIHPDLYAIHNLEISEDATEDDDAVPQPPILPLTAASIDRHGVYLMDAGTYIYVWVGAAIADQLCQDIFDKPNFHSLPEIMVDMPDLETSISELINAFIAHLNEQKPQAAPVIVLREDGRQRQLFLQYLVQDRTESSHSYYEFLQHLQKEVKV